MSAKHQKVEIEIPEEYPPDVRRAIAQDIIEFMRERTADGVDKNNRPFPKYSKAYVESLDFKIAGKSKGSVDLTLSGDMLGALELLSTKKGKVVIGFERGSEENARADGNIRGTYGQSKQTASKRDFLGITDGDLEKILRKYPTDDIKSARNEAIKRSPDGKQSVVETEIPEDDDE